MSIHKLTAGSGYDYLTRQVAALDATEKGHTGLATYYAERGESPGTWIGSGIAGIDGLAAGDVVTAEQMGDLFGAGMHPLTTQRRRELDLRIGRPDQPSPTPADYKAASDLGAPFKVFGAEDISAFRVEVARRLAATNQAAGLPADWAVPAETRARIRTDVARELFLAEHGREPTGAREIAATIARHSRPRTTAVAGYDLTFSPVKSVSTLWALADPPTAAAIERSHHAAIADALRFLERQALFTRLGPQGVRQVDVRGLVASAFTHRDSRAGDPDLHTHVAIANKVQTLDGRWRAIDGRVLFKAVVSASETYNTALEQHLHSTLGLAFAARPQPNTTKRPVREVIGIDAHLNQAFSKRRRSVAHRRDHLAAEFQATHGRPPTPVETLHLAQQATLETRDGKHEPRSLLEQRTAWRTEATGVLGSADAVDRMVRAALAPTARPPTSARSVEWLHDAADRVVDTLEARRATWQYWHVYAEAQRQARTSSSPAGRDLVDRLTHEVLSRRSISLSPTPAHSNLIQRGVTTVPDPDADHDVQEPPPLRRRDGSSSYAVAGAQVFTSARVLAAERRLIAAAGMTDGHQVDPDSVERALRESAESGVPLNPGQLDLVHQMCTSGRRVQVAIAPAGAGKTTAMSALTRAWTHDGGTVLGLAPSAAAAAALRDAITDAAAANGPGTADTEGGVRTDTLAKLTWALDHPVGDPAHRRQPGWVEQIDHRTLAVIDEAGMADTVSLARVADHVLGRGGSVRLVGDDQQLAAIGAGGVLRDILNTHGAVHLSQLVRFTDHAEAAASLALRDGRPEALGFYLDHDRVHVGDLATMTETAFDDWATDRANGLDAIMLAPTRDLVRDLNHRARTHRLHHTDAATRPHPATTTPLADGNVASTGDVIITRTNDRTLRVSATDWVKNGDRWHVVSTHPNGDLSVQHLQHSRRVRLPSAYVRAATGLGYATTIHSAQGITADTMRGVVTGDESRQVIYTMLTRGRTGNHLYLPCVGDGDPHTVIHPTLTHPRTPTDLLEAMLARDETARSATTERRLTGDPTTRLGAAVQRYLDSLHVAAEHHLNTHHPGLVSSIDAAAAAPRAAHPGSGLLAGMADEPAWPTLRSRLLLFAVHGDDPVQAAHHALDLGGLDTATDRAAVLDWRLTTQHRSGAATSRPGPIPWLPPVPPRLDTDDQWGGYLRARAALIDDLTRQVRATVATTAPTGAQLPAWAQNGLRPSPTLLEEVEVWRAAMQVDPTDQRPTGPHLRAGDPALHQRALDRRLHQHSSAALDEWGHLLRRLGPAVAYDPFAPLLAERLVAMSRAGIPAAQLATDALEGGSLPDDHGAAALWWRMARHLTPAVATQIETRPAHPGHGVTPEETELTSLLGADHVGRLRSSTWWPALVSNLDRAARRGWALTDLLPRPTGVANAGLDECLSLVWRTSIALDPVPTDPETAEPPDSVLEMISPPDDLWDGVEDLYAARRSSDWSTPQPLHPTETDIGERTPPTDPAAVRAELTIVAMVHEATPPAPLPPTDADVGRMLQRARGWDSSEVSRERMAEVSELACSYFEQHLAGSWAQSYLQERLTVDISGHPTIRPGYAPHRWTGLTEHLRHRGVTDAELLATGLATTTRRGRLIDRFRDRVVFPITAPTPGTAAGNANHFQVVGFVGRRHPHQVEDSPHPSPKYLNTASTLLYRKSETLFGLDHAGAAALTEGARPVLVEGPVDAIATTLATAGSHVGIATLGTALTGPQVDLLARMVGSRPDRATMSPTDLAQLPIVAFDGDAAGQAAADKAFWVLTSRRFDPNQVSTPSGRDPAGLLADQGPAALAGHLQHATPLGRVLLDRAIASGPGPGRLPTALALVARRPPAEWADAITRLCKHLQTDEASLSADLLQAARSYATDPAPSDAAPTTLPGVPQAHATARATTGTPSLRGDSPPLVSADEDGRSTRLEPRHSQSSAETTHRR